MGCMGAHPFWPPLKPPSLGKADNAKTRSAKGIQSPYRTQPSSHIETSLVCHPPAHAVSAKGIRIVSHALTLHLQTWCHTVLVPKPPS